MSALSRGCKFNGKPCRKCGETLRYFSTKSCVACRKIATDAWSAANADRKNAQSKRSHRALRPDLRRNYGMTATDFAAMWSGQNGRCAICADTLTTTAAGHAVDHCHTTGKVRALTCMLCNRGMGLLGDDPARLEAAAAYLRLHASTLHRTTDDARQH